HLLARYASLVRINPSTGKSGETIEQALETSLNIARAYNDRAAQAFCLAQKGFVLAFQFTPDNHKKALVYFEEAKRLNDMLNDPYYLPGILTIIIWCRGDWEGNEYQQAVDIQRSTGDKYGLRESLLRLMWSLLGHAKLAEAERCMLESLAVDREIYRGQVTA